MSLNPYMMLPFVLEYISYLTKDIKAVNVETHRTGARSQSDSARFAALQMWGPGFEPWHNRGKSVSRFNAREHAHKLHNLTIGLSGSSVSVEQKLGGFVLTPSCPLDHSLAPHWWFQLLTPFLAVGGCLPKADPGDFPEPFYLSIYWPRPHFSGWIMPQAAISTS